MNNIPSNIRLVKDWFNYYSCRIVSPQRIQQRTSDMVDLVVLGFK